MQKDHDRDEPEPNQLDVSFKEFGSLPERPPRWKEFILPVLLSFFLGAASATAMILVLRHEHIIR